jgi:hypothetical protein
MYVKVTMKAVPRSALTEQELKRCRAFAQGNRWQVLEEDAIWWSLDRQSWLPVEDALIDHRRRWLMVETEHGVSPVFLWEVPSQAATQDTGPTADSPAVHRAGSPVPAVSRASTLGRQTA